MDEDVAVLLASELVANAVTHGGEGMDGAKDVGKVEGADGSPRTIAMCVRRLNGKLRVEVHDRSPVMPVQVPLNAEDDSETGRGLMLVDTLAASWGFYRIPGGKVVYFTLPFEADPVETGSFETEPFETGPFGTG
jgi:anti-sigma regulatory factor (Ser/Thr protein kinase)